MKNVRTMLCLLVLCVSCQNFAQLKPAPVANTKLIMKGQSIHQFKVTDLYGETFDFSTLAGKKIIVVNTASKCGLTPQYKELQNLYKQYSDRLVIVGFPANNFAEQEPGSNNEIAAFCEKNYGVNFPMMEKISVKGGDMAAVYQFLTQKKYNGKLDSEVAWNFQKYLIDEEGKLVKMVDPKTQPNDPSIVEWIEGKPKK